MTDLRELYQQLILDHNRKPRNRRALEGAHSSAEGYNPLCGDRVTVYVRLDDDRIADVSFEGEGCAISTASASLMTQMLKGKTLAEMRALFDEFHGMVTGEVDGAPPTERLGKLAVFQGVCEFPTRVKCATLVWHTLRAALDRSGETVTTED
ncbi:MAG: Fe-S cluster assembly sulfur transfer protein SufU [Planctomycetota bacterium]|jgi:nitrogen fixation NifU-like protein